MAYLRLPEFVDTLARDAAVYPLAVATEIVARMRRGDEFAYYRGQLSHDRYIPMGMGECANRDRRSAIHQLANMMSALEEGAAGTLVQRKMGERDYMYLYVR